MDDATQKGGDVVACPICPHRCKLREGQLGRCRARRRARGRVAAENYGRVTSVALDPVEKKPLAMFMPGAKVLSVGSYGCNMSCPWCQNASIAAAGANDVNWQEYTPEALVQFALDLRQAGNIGVAYTYNEPLVGYEFVRDCAALAHEAGLVNVLVSNGQVNAGPLRGLLPLIDAANIDLKGFTQGAYDIAGGSLKAAKETIAAMAASKSCHLEVTTLVISGINDSDDEIEAIAAWLAGLNRDTPYHVSRFFPCHRMQDAHPTPVSTVYKLASIARRHLAHVYTGNC